MAHINGYDWNMTPLLSNNDDAQTTYNMVLLICFYMHPIYVS